MEVTHQEANEFAFSRLREIVTYDSGHSPALPSSDEICASRLRHSGSFLSRRQLLFLSPQMARPNFPNVAQFELKRHTCCLGRRIAIIKSICSGSAHGDHDMQLTNASALP